MLSVRVVGGDKRRRSRGHCHYYFSPKDTSLRSATKEFEGSQSSLPGRSFLTSLYLTTQITEDIPAARRRPPTTTTTIYHHQQQASTHAAFTMTMTNNMNMTTMNPHRHRRSHRRRRPRSSDTTSITNDGGGSSANNANKIIAIGLVVFCFINILDLDILLVNHQGGTGTGRRRSLLSTLYLAGPSTLLPWAHHHLIDVTDRPDPLAKNALFWRE